MGTLSAEVLIAVTDEDNRERHYLSFFREAMLLLVSVENARSANESLAASCVRPTLLSGVHGGHAFCKLFKRIARSCWITWLQHNLSARSWSSSGSSSLAASGVLLIRSH